jgi:hypothetical protein
MLNAQTSVRYYQCLTDRFRDRDTFTKIFLAATSSSTVAGWAIFTDAATYPRLVVTWKLLSGLSALLALALPILGFPKKVEAAARLSGEYAEISKDYEMLWLVVDDLPNEQILNTIKQLSQKEFKLTAIERELPTNEISLIRKCQEQVIHSRGINKGQQ